MNEPFRIVTEHHLALEGAALWAVIPLALLAALFAWRLYRAELEKLTPPLRRAIRILRASTLALLIMALANPTWEEIRREIHKPLVAVVVDGSRSMEHADAEQRPEELVRLALALGELPHTDRTSDAAENAVDLRAAKRLLGQAEARLHNAAGRALHAAEEPDTRKTVAEAVAAAKYRVRQAAGLLDQVLPRAAQVEAVLGGEQNDLRLAEDARLGAQRLRDVVLGGFLPSMYERAAAFEGALPDVHAVEEAALETSDSAELCLELALAYEDLQDRSDRRLLETADAPAQARIRALAALPRREIARRLLAGPNGLAESLRENYRLRFFAADDGLRLIEGSEEHGPSWEAAGAGTDLGSALEQLARQIAHENLAGAVLLGDGRHTEGPEPLAGARQVAALGIPLHTAGLGSLAAPRDVCLFSVQAPESLYVKEKLEVRALARATGLAGATLQATLWRGDREVETVSHAVGGDAEVAELVFAPQDLEAGEHAFRVVCAPLEGERIPENNRLEFSVRAIERRQQMLLVEGLPRWQQVELSAALRASAHVAVHEVVLGTQPERRMEVGEKFEIVEGKSRRLRRGPESGQYPESREALFEFDAVFLGDFPVLDLAYEEQKALADFVQFRGGTLVLLAGPDCNPHQVEDSGLGDLLPVALPLLGSDDAHLAFRAYHQDGYGLELTYAGRASPLCRLAPDLERNTETWARLRSFWRYPQLQAKPDVQVLVRSADEQHEPLIVAQQVGLGRVLYVGLDDVWRWKAEHAAYARRFWDNVLRWALAGGMSSRGRRLGLATDKRRYGPGEHVVTGVQVRDEDGYGVADDVLKARAHRAGAASEAQAEIALQPLKGSPGLYRGRFDPLPDGLYELRLESARFPQEAAQLGGVTFAVGRDPFLEHLDLTLNRDMLEQIAHEGGGQYFSPDRLAGLPKHLEKGTQRETTRRHARSLWDHYVFVVLLLGLLALEWVLRKTRGLL